MRRLMLFLTVLAFFVNPGLACTSTDDGTFQFGEAEMRTAVEGRWQIDWNVAGGASTSVTVDILEGGVGYDGGASVMRPSGQRHGFIRSAAACDSRTFVRSAGACVDVSRMDLQVAYVSGDSALQAEPIGGTFSVYGLSFGTGYLHLVFGKTSVSVGLGPDGTVRSTSGMSPEGQLTVTAKRVAP
jgi:hypothetical protein